MSMIIKLGVDTLCAGGTEGPAGMSINGRSVAQISDLIRADEPAIYDRKNRKTTIRFTINKRFTDVADAEMYMLDLATDLTRHGQLEIRAKSVKKEIARYLHVAHLTDVSIDRQVGVTVFVTFTIEGGLIHKEPVS